ncbi:Nicotinate-nucleotide adenylyltransferase [hydrothermal vent metagenome]|uniref:Nicotinate-nucleotide adenylyltransferase n=1 Tax=hydrothermal vent metagenome TaxID=652676 RepID=A0A3B1BEM1_9ZZZZ
MIGILGGTFDPIHYGHLRPALDIQQTLGLDEIRLIPLRDPSHRKPPIATPEQRLAMLHAAIEGQTGFSIDTQELERGTKSYTVHTLRTLRATAGTTIPICLLIGTDAFHDFANWHKPEEILQLAHLVVMQRHDEPMPSATPLTSGRLTKSTAALKTSPGGRILFQPVTQLEISSTAIKAMIINNQNPRYLLPDSVLHIIRQQQLYR